MAKRYTYNEVQQHRSQESCWVVLYGHVYDVTTFLPDHPGGTQIILQLAGTDATEEYDPIHPPGLLEETLPASAKLGTFDESTLPKPKEQQNPSEANFTQQTPSTNTNTNKPTYEITSLSDCLNLDDIETLATAKLSRKAWGYYYSAADDLRSKTLNNAIYSRILLRPRIFIDCTRCSLATKLANQRVQVPFYVSPAAMARLGHADGEAGIARACARFGALQVISHNASQTPETIVAGAAEGQVFAWQLYVQTDRRKSEAMLDRIRKLDKVKALVLTLDAAVPGKREDDERTKSVGAKLPVSSAVKKTGAETEEISEPAGDGGVGKALFAGTAPDLTWKTTLPWLKKHTTLPLFLKGIQTHEDAYLAALHAPHVKGIILSNHGGRAMDTAPPAVHTLLEIRKFCPEVFDRVEVWVDGGIRRGTDVVKALCLGAKGVGIGRAPLFGLGAGGVAGVERVLEILKAETETAMRLLGVETVEELGLQHVNARAVEREIYNGVGTAGLKKVARWGKSRL